MDSHKNPISEIEFHEHKKDFFLSLSLQDQSQVLLETTDSLKEELLLGLPENHIIKVFKYLDPDEIVDLLQLLPKRKQNRLINKVSKSLKEHITFLSSFAPESAAGVMSLNYLLIPYNTPKEEIISRIKHHLKKGFKEPTLLVVDDFGHMLGELRISTLLFENNLSIYDKLKELPSIYSSEDQESCLHCFKKHAGEKVVVLDDDGLVLGIIKAKEMLKVLEQENEEDYFGLAGLRKEEQITATASQKVHFRLSWLLVNLATAFLAAFVVSVFESTISQFVLLAVFMPIIAGMGGNAGTQTTAILIRSLALKRVDSGLKKILLSESLGAMINGIVIGVVVALISLFFGASEMFALVAFIAVVLNLIAAAIFGTLIPIILDKLNIDPAAASNVFVTTITDVFGFFIFLGLGSILLI